MRAALALALASRSSEIGKSSPGRAAATAAKAGDAQGPQRGTGALLMMVSTIIGSQPHREGAERCNFAPTTATPTLWVLPFP